MKKNANPYEKKQKSGLRITRKQLIAILGVLAVIAILLGMGFMRRSTAADPHAGHNHAEGEECGVTTTADAHAGHNHADATTTAADAHAGHTHADGEECDATTTTAKSEVAADKIKYTFSKSGDKYVLFVRDEKGKPLLEKRDLYRPPMEEELDKETGVYALGWPTDKGPNDFYYVFYNKKTGALSDVFCAPRGYDGVRVAYSSEDQTKVIVQDIFNKKGYYKEYELKDAQAKNGNIIMGGKASEDNKKVTFSYQAKDGYIHYLEIDLYA